MTGRTPDDDSPHAPDEARLRELAARLGHDPAAVDEDDLGAADRFCALACLRYDAHDSPGRRDAAAALLAATPSLVAEHLGAAAAAGDPVAVREHLRRDPAAAGRFVGPYPWEPLLYLCYSRVPSGHGRADVLEVATLLLDAGADPNAGFLWQSLTPPFTALTGVLGDGEQGPVNQPRHRDERDLAVLLLERGADPEDRQGLYNRMFVPGTEHLELLIEHGLGHGEDGPWVRRLGSTMESRTQMLQRQWHWATHHHHPDRLALLERHGLRP